MKDIPFEIFELISYNLDPLELSVSKSLHSIYNDNWYHTFLKITYPTINLYTKTNYKDLYDLSLLQGDMCFMNRDCEFLNIKGIKGQHIRIINIRPNYYSILTFNGDCYVTNGTIKIFMDNNVDDIYDSYYFKENEIYQIRNHDGIIICKPVNLTQQYFKNRHIVSSKNISKGANVDYLSLNKVNICVTSEMRHINYKLMRSIIFLERTECPCGSKIKINKPGNLIENLNFIKHTRSKQHLTYLKTMEQITSTR